MATPRSLLVSVLEQLDAADLLLCPGDLCAPFMVDELADGFDELGAVRPGPWIDRETDLPAYTVCGRPPAQAGAALAALSGDGRELAPDEVTVGVPNDEVVPHLSERLEERGLAEHEKYKGVTLTDDGILRARDALQTYCIIERFLANVLDVAEFRAEARELEPVIDDTVAERLDTIIDRNPECPDCFDAETDACCYLDVESETPAD